MYDNPRNLLDQITLMHGPHDLLARYFVMADAVARDWGLRFRLRSDFDALVELNRDNRETWPPLPPTFDPAYSNLRIDSAFWLEGIDDRGETVATEMARLFDFKDTNVVEELRALRTYYEDPAPHVAAGERIDIDAPAATAVRGRTMHGGAIWVRPDWRRNGLTRILSRICAAYALTRWDTAFTWGLVEPRLHAGGLSQAYGPHEVAQGVTLRLAFRGELPAVLIWMRAAALLADLARAVDHAPVLAGQRYAHEEPIAVRGMPRER
jgi:GNAT superfamily N-acetyltransferase